MRILIAEDDRVSRLLLQSALTSWGYEVTVTEDGCKALAAIQGPEPPDLAILDWMMPGMDGIEVTREVRKTRAGAPTSTFIILLTARCEKQDIVVALEAGADDYLTKPFHREELGARVWAGMRIVNLQKNLAERVKQLETAIAQVKQLHGLLPVCSYCKKIRDDQDKWRGIEDYISEHSDASFSHGICPDCYDTTVKNDLENFKKNQLAI